MSFFSRSKGHHYRHGHHGSNHYKKKGVMGNLFNMIASRSSSGGHYNNSQHYNYPLQNKSLTQQGLLECPKCRFDIPQGSKFCLNCGEPVKKQLFCNNCGNKIPSNSKYCPECGNKID